MLKFDERRTGHLSIRDSRIVGDPSHNSHASLPGENLHAGSQFGIDIVLVYAEPRRY